MCVCVCIHIYIWSIYKWPICIFVYIYIYITIHIYTHICIHYYTYTLYIYNVCVCMLGHFSHVWLCATLWTVACQVPLSMGFPRQGYWSGLPCPPPGDLPNPEIKPRSPALQADSLPWAQASFLLNVLLWKKVKMKSLSHVWLFVTPWTVAYEAPPSMGFSRQEYFSRGSSWPRDRTQVSHIVGRSLPSEPPGNPAFSHDHVLKRSAGTGEAHWFCFHGHTHSMDDTQLAVSILSSSSLSWATVITV